MVYPTSSDSGPCIDFPFGGFGVLLVLVIYPDLIASSRTGDRVEHRGASEPNLKDTEAANYTLQLSIPRLMAVPTQRRYARKKPRKATLGPKALKTALPEAPHCARQDSWAL